MTDIKKDILWRVYLVYFSILLFGLAIIVKIFFIQFKEGPKLRVLSQTQELRAFNLEANRGNILAADGSLLATSVPVFEIRMDVASPNISDKYFLDHIDELSEGLSNILGNRSYKDFKNYLIKSRRNGKRYVLLGKKVEYAQLKQIRELPILKLGKHRGGLIAIQTPKRAFPFNELAARTIGYENKTEKYFVGLEGAYTDVLTGIDGKQVMRRINHGDWIPVHDENEVEPQDGKDILTTIDINIQDIAENALLSQLLEKKAFQGCAVVMEVNTGHIKAIANLRYDSTDGKYKEIYNYAVGESIEPGSTFKLANMLVGLEDEKFKLTDSVVTGVGFAVIEGIQVQDVHKIGNGRVTIRDVFEHSSNVGMAKIFTEAYKNETSKYADGLQEMSLNQPLGIEIIGEGKPLIKHPKTSSDWWGTSLTVMSFGYEVRQTPLQTLTYYNAIANNGKMVKPVFVTEIRSGDITKERFGTDVINQKIASQKTIDSTKSLLEGVVSRGTAHRAFYGTPYKVAGKTGTAKIVTDGEYLRNYNASFVGYFPADDPKYSCIVSINRPTEGGYYGGVVAAPAFREIADKIYSTSLVLDLKHETQYGEVEKPAKTNPANYDDLKSIYSALNINTIDYLYNEQWAVARLSNDTIEFESAEFSETRIPDVKGMNAKDAVFLLENMGLKTNLSGRGLVRKQSMKAGTPIQKGSTINLQLAVY